MNATHGSLLVEFGTEVNTIDEVKYLGQLFGDALVKNVGIAYVGDVFISSFTIDLQLFKES